MIEIAEMADSIRDEIDDAAKYARYALKYKESRPQLAALYLNLAGQEMEHKAMLHNGVMMLIEEYRKTHGDPPADMQARYDLEHEIVTDKAIKAKTMIQMARE